VTPNQLEKKARQLVYRRRLADTIEVIEDTIKTCLMAGQSKRLTTKSFVISLDGDELLIKAVPRFNRRQLRLKLRKRF
jgi:hypothetical protein